MSRTKKLKRVIAISLTLIMLLALVPFSAVAGISNDFPIDIPLGGGTGTFTVDIAGIHVFRVVGPGAASFNIPLGTQMGSSAVDANTFDYTFNLATLGPHNFTVADAVNVTLLASPTPPTFAIDLTQTVGGTITAGYTTAAAGTTVRIQAVANQGFTFTGWTVGGVTAVIPNVASTEFVMPANAVTVQATFAPNTNVVTGVTIPGGNRNMTVGGTLQLSANVSGTNLDATNQRVTWTSSNTSVATVGLNSGLVTAFNVGTTTIRATTSNPAIYTEITLTVSQSVVTGVTITGGNRNMTVGSTLTLQAVVTPANAPNRDVTWTSSNTNVASIDAYGVVTAQGLGTTTITVTTVDGGRTYWITITVSPSTVTGVSIYGGNFSIAVGNTRQLQAVITPANAPNRDVTWASSNTTILTIDANGVVTAHGMGTATITVTTADGGRTATVTVTVTPRVAVTGVTIPGGNFSLTTGSTRQLNANFTPSNATNTNVTWATNNAVVATVDANGLVTARNPGSAVITVTTQDGSFTASVAVTVTPAVQPPQFTDVPPTAWFRQYVDTVTSAGLFQGTAPGIFSPNSTMTRAMFAQVMANLEGVNLASYAGVTPSFVDVSPNSWYFTAVEWAARMGIVTGFDGGNFAPNAPVTREQIAVMIYRYINIAGISLPHGIMPVFTDQGSVSSWAVDAVNAMQAASIITGRPDGRFDPQATATRAEVAAIFARLLELI